MDAFRARDYEHAIQGFRSELVLDPSDPIANGGLATSLFALGRYLEAIPFMEKEGEYERARIKGSPGWDLRISVAHWCAGQSSTAINLMSNLVADVSRGKVTYANDTVGGVIYGMYLYYYATMLGETELVQQALPFMQKLNEKQVGRIGFNKSPLPSARQILGLAAFEDVLMTFFGVTSPKEARVRMGASRVARLDLCEALFWDGVVKYASGEQGKFKERMLEVRDLQTNREYSLYHLALFGLAQQER